MNVTDEMLVLDDIKETESDERELILPTKSKSLYENAYRDYRMWCTKENINITTEDSIMTYFNSELGSYKSSTLWTKYSMLRSTINLNEGVDISKFPSLIPYLKEKGEGHKPKQSLTLTKENVDNFLKQASNKEHLLNKVVLIFGVSGACGRQELVSLETTNVEDHETHFLVRLTETETKTERSFIIVPGNLENLNLLDIIRKYRALRSPKTPHNRFFVNYLREKCTVQPVGVHKIASVPKMEMSPILRKGNTVCCVNGCLNSYRNTDNTVKFYSIPSKPHEQERRNAWIAVIRKESCGDDWIPKKYSKICSKHFVGNRKSQHPWNPSYNPTIFPNKNFKKHGRKNKKNKIKFEEIAKPEAVQKKMSIVIENTQRQTSEILGLP